LLAIKIISCRVESCDKRKCRKSKFCKQDRITGLFINSYLLFRKTKTFGSLVCITVLMNIVAMNFCYDVPVKLFSSNLLLMAKLLVSCTTKPRH
jgi:hypothetical protein